MAKKILVLSGSPREGSFSERLAATYVEHAESKHEVRFHKVSEMNFNSNLESYNQQSLESDLEAFQNSVSWANHLVVVSPIWWGALPAKLKGVFDRTFLPGFAYKFEPGKMVQRKLLAGKTARIIFTMDTPVWYYKLYQRAPALHQLKITTLEFCGFKKVKSNMFGPIIKASDKAKSDWLDRVQLLGAGGQ